MFLLRDVYKRQIINFIQAMDYVVPGFAAYETLLYSPELKFYSNRVKMDTDFNTSLQGDVYKRQVPAQQLHDGPGRQPRRLRPALPVSLRPHGRKAPRRIFPH